MDDFLGSGLSTRNENGAVVLDILRVTFFVRTFRPAGSCHLPRDEQPPFSIVTS
jgi:hypothetical protein